MALRTGKEYVSGLSDGREIWLAGEQVAVAEHPALRPVIDSVAGLYDLQHDPAVQAEVSYQEAPGGPRYPIGYLIPRDREDLVTRRTGITCFAEACFGLMGRTPDNVATLVMAFASAAEFFSGHSPRFGDNIRAYYQWCRENDPFIAIASANPQVDRSRGLDDLDDPLVPLKIVRETSDGLVVKGAKMTSTLAPVTDELLVFPIPGYRKDEHAYTAGFAIPVNTPGLRIVCREPYAMSGRNRFDHPLSRFDEIDATCVFDDVLVPWDRVFFHGDPDAANSLIWATTGFQHQGHHGMIRGLAKAELMVAVAVRLAESTRSTAHLHVKEMLGEVLGLLDSARACLLLSEVDATRSRWGTFVPAASAVYTSRYQFPAACDRMAEVIRILGSGAIIAAPTAADLAPGLPHDVGRYFATGDMTGPDRIGLLKLAWELSGDAFGQRQLLYERYYGGDPVRLAAAHYQTYDKQRLEDVLLRALAG